MSYSQKYAKHSGRSAVYVSRQTNTPPEFLICNKCQEKFTPKLNVSNQLIGDCQSLSEYSKALNYINSCHNIINQMTKCTESETDHFVSMPDLPNFVDLFNVLNNIKQKFVAQTAQRHSTPHMRDESPLRKKSNESHSRSDDERYQAGSDDEYDNQYERKAARSKTTEKASGNAQTRGTYLELLSESKPNEVKQRSVPTSETEDSELEIELLQNTPRMAMQNKFKQKINAASARENVIYEEDVSEDIRGRKCQQDAEVNRQHSRQKLMPARMKSGHTTCVSNANTPRTAYPSNVAPNTAPAAGQKNDVAKKLKPRSASSNTPREKPQKSFPSPNVQKKIGNEVSGNYSDTVIAVNGPIKQNKKVDQKTLTHPIEFANDGQLSQRDLDKFAKELLGSGSPSPRSNSPDSRTFSPKSPSRPKIEEKAKSPKSKALTIKPNECKRKPSAHDKCSQPNLIQSPSRNQQVQTTQNVSSKLQPQAQPHTAPAKKPSKCYSSSTSKMTDSQQSHPKVPPTSLKSTPKQHNLFLGHRSNEAVFAASTTTNLTQLMKSNLMYSTSSTAQQAIPENVDAYTMQQRSKRQKSKSRNAGEVNESSREQCRTESSGQQTVPYASVDRQSRPESPKVPAQYSVTPKPADFFTVNRSKSSHKRKSRAQLYEDGEGVNMESDDIKTDSDIDEDHFEKRAYENSQSKFHPDQLAMEAKAARAHDERNKPFREPRKSTSPFGREDQQIVHIQETGHIETYSATSHSQMRRTYSEESSDIKSDNEDEYEQGNEVNMQGRTLNYNYCQGNNRYHPS